MPSGPAHCGRRPGAVVALVGSQPQAPGDRRQHDDFIDEVVKIIDNQPDDATEIDVENVKFLRYGEARGDYPQVVATLNQFDPHGH